MTIVASNSLTLSKVNDGTITHTAYSYSADGIDRFTTTYPNLNLLTGTTEPFVMGYGIPRTTWDATNKVSKISLPVTTAYPEVLPQDTGFPYTYIPGVTYTQSIYISTDAPLTGTPIKFTWFTNNYNHNTAGADNLVKVSTNIYRATSTYTWPSSNSPSTGRNADFSNLTQVFDFTKGTFLQFYKPKLEPGSIATPYMQSASEVTTADWPKYRGEYSDMSSEQSMNPSDYTWSLIRGNDGKDGLDGKDGIAGKDGVGIKTTVITYAISTSGTTEPTTGWTSSVPTLIKGQFLWTKTVWTYTDNSSETGYSVTYISKDGNNGTDGIAGKDGVGIKITTITYAQSTSGTTVPSTGWTSSVPSVPAGQFLWTKTVWTYTDNTSETGYSVAMMGPKGERGKQIFKSNYESVPHNTGHYWSDLSPAPSIDNPPKIGDTVITPSGNILQIETVNVGGGGGGGTFGVGDVLGNIKGPSGAPGSNGAPGKVVSDTEPISLFKGLTWKYSGTAKLTASDGTVINPNTEYFYNGTHWVINYFSVNNFASESITSDKIDGKNLTITNGQFISNTTNGQVTSSTEIKDNHIAISKTDGTINIKNDIALDSEQGLAQKFTNNSTGFYRTAGINFQGPFTNDSDGNYAQLTPQGTKLSTDVPWTTLASTGGFSGGTIQFSIQNGVAYFSVSGVNVPSMTGGAWYQCAQLPTGSRAIPSVNRVTTAFANASVWGFLVSTSGGLYFQSKNNTSPTANLANALAAFPIG